MIKLYEGKMKKIATSVLIVSTLLSAQSLKMSVSEVLGTNPVILERLKNYNATKEDITIAESGYYPKLDLSIGIGKEKGERAGGTDFDYSVYQNSLSYTQNLFKGFETTYQVQEHENRTIAAAYSYLEKVNDTSFKMIDTYLQVMRNKELLDNAQANIDINAEILNKVQKLYDSGLTTLSEVNKIEASLSLAKSNYSVQENTLLDVKFQLQRVLGRNLKHEDMSRPQLVVILPKSIEDATLVAMENNPSLLVSKYNVKLAQATYHKSKAPFYPSLDIEVSKTMTKNLSGVEGKYDNLRAMAYLKYNFFNGFADKATLQQSVSTIHKEVQIKNTLRREVIEGISLSWAANEKLTDQLGHLQNYKKFSQKTLSLYSKEYDLGRRSLLDLLSSQNDFIASKAQIINTEYSMLFAKYRILDAMGMLVSTVMEDGDISCSNVGFKSKMPKNSVVLPELNDTDKDVLPILYDVDRDLIVDEVDICNNSLPNDMKNIYGCKETFEDVKRIERYSGFLFDNDNSTLTQDGESRLNSLIKQIEPYGWENLKFSLLGNVENINMSKDDILLLSQRRAQVVKDKLIKAGAFEDNITLHANSDKNPMYSDEESESVALNNRTDIIVKKLKLNK
ncbi:TolC family outer membrane protein [Candidatus Sulfurimonas marisnigri]|nr:TolC family outer membrane protein [Candidatus Sulfurimonas marisnigri]